MTTRVLLSLAAALCLVACVRVPPPAVPVNEITALKLAGVEVEGIEVIRSWPAEETVFLATNRDPEIARRLPGESAQNFPPVQAHFRRVLQQRFSYEVSTALAPIMTGTRPVKAVVRLKAFDVPSVGRRMLLSGGAVINAQIDLVDARNGQLVLSYAGKPAGQRMVTGVIAAPIATALGPDEDPGKSLITTAVTEYRTWLIER